MQREMLRFKLPLRAYGVMERSLTETPKVFKTFGVCQKLPTASR